MNKYRVYLSVDIEADCLHNAEAIATIIEDDLIRHSSLFASNVDAYSVEEIKTVCDHTGRVDINDRMETYCVECGEVLGR
jgi:hypothetical protein